MEAHLTGATTATASNRTTSEPHRSPADTPPSPNRLSRRPCHQPRPGRPAALPDLSVYGVKRDASSTNQYDTPGGWGVRAGREVSGGAEGWETIAPVGRRDLVSGVCPVVRVPLYRYIDPYRSSGSAPSSAADGRAARHTRSPDRRDPQSIPEAHAAHTRPSPAPGQTYSRSPTRQDTSSGPCADCRKCGDLGKVPIDVRVPVNLIRTGLMLSGRLCGVMAGRAVLLQVSDLGVVMRSA